MVDEYVGMFSVLEEYLVRWVVVIGGRIVVVDGSDV